MRNTFTKLLSVLLVLLMVLSLASCAKNNDSQNSSSTDDKASNSDASSSDASNSDASTDDEHYVIGATFSNETMLFFTQMQYGFKEVVEEHGDEAIVYIYEDDAAKLADQIDQLIVKDVDFIVANIYDAKSFIPSLRKLQDAEIPIILMDFAPEEEEYQKYFDAAVLNEYYQSQYNATSNLLAAFEGQEATVGGLFLNPLNPSQIELVKGHDDAIADALTTNSQLTVLDTSYASSVSADTALEIVTAVGQLHPDLDAYACAWYQAGLAAINGFESVGLKVGGEDGIKLAVGDADRTLAQMVKDGTLHNIMDNDSYGIGRKGAELAYEYLEEGITHGGEKYYVEPVIYDATNVDEYIAKLDRLGLD